MKSLLAELNMRYFNSANGYFHKNVEIGLLILKFYHYMSGARSDFGAGI